MEKKKKRLWYSSFLLKQEKDAGNYKSDLLECLGKKLWFRTTQIIERQVPGKINKIHIIQN